MLQAQRAYIGLQHTASCCGTLGHHKRAFSVSPPSATIGKLVTHSLCASLQCCVIACVRAMCHPIGLGCLCCWSHLARRCLFSLLDLVGCFWLSIIVPLFFPSWSILGFVWVLYHFFFFCPLFYSHG